MRSPFLLASSLVLLSTAVPAVSAQNLVSNPGFETGDFTSWTLGGNTTFMNVLTGSWAYSGTYGAQFGPVGSNSTMTQTLATTPGQSYTLSYWLENDIAGTSFFGATWDGVIVEALASPGAFGYTQFSWNVVAVDASTDLQFQVRHDPSFFAFDDVSVTADSTVPEPASMTLLATGLAGLAAARKRRRTQA